jgi:hypothetical protein
MRNIFTILFLGFLIYIISGCDKGIEPAAPTPTGFSGTVTFTGTWPKGIQRTHVVVFNHFIQSSADFSPPNLSFVVDSIPYGSKTFTYNSVINSFISLLQVSPGDYKYIIVAQSKTPALSLDRKDWFVVGVYTTTGDQSKPGTMLISDGMNTPGININVDFNNSPPQPPEN